MRSRSGEVARGGDVDEQVAPALRVVGVHHRPHPDQPVLVEVVVRHDVSGDVQLGAIEVASTISAERSAASSAGVGLCGQCESESTVWALAAPSTITLGRSASCGYGTYFINVSVYEPAATVNCQFQVYHGNSFGPRMRGPSTSAIEVVDDEEHLLDVEPVLGRLNTTLQIIRCSGDRTGMVSSRRVRTRIAREGQEEE